MGLITTPYLEKKIASTQKEINNIKASIERFEQGVQDAEEARKLFQKFIKEIDLLVDETSLYFKGTAAPAFRMRLLKSSSFCADRDIDMQHKIHYYKECINNLEANKRACQKTIDNCEAWIKICKWLIV